MQFQKAPAPFDGIILAVVGRVIQQLNRLANGIAERHHALQKLCALPTAFWAIIHLVVFQKWSWTAIAVTLGLVFEASMRKEWPMTFIAVRCPHCQSDQIVKRGKTARGTQRYLRQNTLCAKV